MPTNPLLNPPVDQEAERARVKKLPAISAPSGYYHNLLPAPSAIPVPRAPAPARDATLTALAQLGPLRLQCDRAFVSLIDRSQQYIIAEANTLASAISTPNVKADYSSYCIRDLRDQPEYVDRPYVRGWPHMRSYLEVPLRTSSGICIGSYSVIDSRPRDDFDDAAVAVLEDIAQAIMDHIELVKMQEQHKRLERLVNSLCLYVEENTTMQAFEEKISAEDWQSADVPVTSPSSDSDMSEGPASGRRSPEVKSGLHLG
ncbi:sensor histidine kinase response protein [Botryosphaeria dothidea]|uniref:Sensor histidine kinase response protein n=1 Tax=Botryosphaeria dothidea TaxID=55169 RepID=A0A8H4ILZ2_9PEZI|nr:sensor histidine kinase response protein [Botryosphaeria dothidea]